MCFTYPTRDARAGSRVYENRLAVTFDSTPHAAPSSWPYLAANAKLAGQDPRKVAVGHRLYAESLLRREPFIPAVCEATLPVDVFLAPLAADLQPIDVEVVGHTCKGPANIHGQTLFRFGPGPRLIPSFRLPSEARIVFSQRTDLQLGHSFAFDLNPHPAIIESFCMDNHGHTHTCWSPNILPQAKPPMAGTKFMCLLYELCGPRFVRYPFLLATLHVHILYGDMKWCSAKLRKRRPQQNGSCQSCRRGLVQTPTHPACINPWLLD